MDIGVVSHSTDHRQALWPFHNPDLPKRSVLINILFSNRAAFRFFVSGYRYSA